MRCRSVFSRRITLRPLSSSISDLPSSDSPPTLHGYDVKAQPLSATQPLISGSAKDARHASPCPVQLRETAGHRQLLRANSNRRSVEWKSAGSGFDSHHESRLSGQLRVGDACQRRPRSARPLAGAISEVLRPQTLSSVCVSGPRRQRVAFAKDKWTNAVPQSDGKVTRERDKKRWGRGKQRSRAFETKTQALRYASAMETDRDRGDYLDPNAGKVRPEEIWPRWMGSRTIDPASEIQYDPKWRLHVEPVFGRRMAGASCRRRPGVRSSCSTGVLNSQWPTSSSSATQAGRRSSRSPVGGSPKSFLVGRDGGAHRRGAP
jgi:hypothetical protein